MLRPRFGGALLVCAALSCATEPGPQGPIGPAGPTGAMGAMGTPGKDATLTFPDCPIGYSRDMSVTNIALCKKGLDEVVKVGTGGSAFWIDRYEASVWPNSDGSGQQYGAMADDYPPTFPKNGQATQPLYSVSRAGVTPSRFVTWFQANKACRASGKRLMTADEWFAAIEGTLDPGTNDGTSGACVTQSPSLRVTAQGSKCESVWGVQDMIGNLAEWTAEWYATGRPDIIVRFPGQGFGADAMFTPSKLLVSSSAADAKEGFPAAALRGGEAAVGTEAGIFYLALSLSPAGSQPSVGFRCVVPR